jgi:surface antigen
MRATFTLAACLALAGGALHAANLGFLNNAPLSRMTAEDVDILQSALNDALDNGADGQPTDWANRDTGAGGTLIPLESYDGAGGQRCRRLRVKNHAGGLKAENVLALCRQPDGTWIPQQ